MSESNLKVPSKGDHILATAISEGEIRPTSDVVGGIIRLKLNQSAQAAITSPHISERESIHILTKFTDLIEPFLLANNYSSDRLRQVIREEIAEEALLSIIDHCTLMLENALSSLLDKRSEMLKYVRFVAILIDSKFVQWYVKSSWDLQRLTKVVNQYRQALFKDQQLRAKSDGSQIADLIRQKTDPKFNGKVFIHHLNL